MQSMPRAFGESFLSLLLLCVDLGGTLPAADIAASPTPGSDVRYTNVLPDWGGKKLVPNGSFEAGTDGWSSLGKGGGISFGSWLRGMAQMCLTEGPSGKVSWWLT